MALSRFLPPGFEPGHPVAIIAGRGDYPAAVARRMRSLGLKPRLVELVGETREDVVASFPPEDRARVRVGQIGRLLKCLKELDTRNVLMVGQVKPEGLFGGIHPDLKAVRMLASLRERNAHTIFGAIVAEIEGIGCRVLDARAFLDDDLAVEGVLTGGRQRADTVALEHGIRIAREVARLDIGQSVVVREGTVLLVEGFDGTDGLLRHASEFRASGKIFVKVAKPGHDFRFDVPVFGLQTVASLHQAGIRTAALEAGRTIILDKEDVLAEARRRRIEVIGFAPGDGD